MQTTPADSRARTRLEDLLHAYRRSQVLIASVELGVFTGLAPGPATAEQLGARLGVPGARLQPLLDADLALGLLERQGAGYANSAAAARHLAAPGPGYLGNWIASEGSRSAAWQDLAAVIRAPRPAAQPAPGGAAPEELPRRQQRSLQDIAEASNDAVAAAASSLRSPDAPTRVGDLGGGHGAYSVDLIRRFPAWTATVFDRPQTLQLARARAAEQGVGERVATSVLDLRQEWSVEGRPLEEEIDLALLFMVLVAMPPEEAPGLLRRLHRALRPGGWLLIRGFYWREPLEEAMFDLQSLMHHDACRAYSVERVSGWLGESGFADIHVVDAPEPERHTLLAARRPGQPQEGR